MMEMLAIENFYRGIDSRIAATFITIKNLEKAQRISCYLFSCIFLKLIRAKIELLYDEFHKFNKISLKYLQLVNLFYQSAEEKDKIKQNVIKKRKLYLEQFRDITNRYIDTKEYIYCNLT